MAPMTDVQVPPAMTAMRPARLMPAISDSVRFPPAWDPMMMITVPAPVTTDPNKIGSRCRHGFYDQRRRRSLNHLRLRNRFLHRGRRRLGPHAGGFDFIIGV